eukprot:314178_1
MADILKNCRNQLIVQRNQLIDELDLKYANYIMQILQQQTIIKMNIQTQYDQHIHWIESQLNTQSMHYNQTNNKNRSNSVNHTYQNVNENICKTNTVPRIASIFNHQIIKTNMINMPTLINSSPEPCTKQKKSNTKSKKSNIKSNKLMKKPKDIHAPKKNRSVFFIFRADRWQELQSTYICKNAAEISQILSLEWKAMTETDKNVYIQRAAEEKKIYLQQISIYKKTENYRIHTKKLNDWKKQKTKFDKRKKVRKPKRPISMPKKPPTSFFMFNNKRTEELHQKYPYTNITEFSKLLSIEWNDASKETKEIYQQEANKRRKKWKLDMAEYKKCDEFKRYQQRLYEWKKCNDMDINYKLPRKPKCSKRPKKPLSSFFLFGKHIRKTTIFSKRDSFNSQQDIAKEISKKWNELDGNEKQKYIDEAMKLKEIYKKEMEEYKGSKAEIEYERKLKDWRQECDKRKDDAIRKANRKEFDKEIVKRNRNESNEIEKEINRRSTRIKCKTKIECKDIENRYWLSSEDEEK